MRSKWKLTVACSVMGLLLLAAGCGSRSQEDTQTSTGGTPTSGEENAGQTSSVDRDAHGAHASAGDTPGATTQPTAQTTRPTVLIETSMGNITVELDDEKAPLTVENFLSYVESGFYDQTIFHQVFPGAVILGGMFTADLVEKEANAPVSN